MPIVFDWTVPIAAFASFILSSLAFVVSLIALYLAHLRGPNISLISSGSLYPCSGFYYNGGDNSFIVEANLLVANNGNRPGILFSLRLDPVSEGIIRYTIKPSYEADLPTLLVPGGTWATKASIVIQPRSGTWKDYFSRQKSIQMRAVYMVNASFGRMKSKTTRLNINIEPVKVSAPELLGADFDNSIEN